MFTWIPIYKELASKLLDFSDRQTELILVLKKLAESGLPIITLTDIDSGDHEFELKEIDPFTFFATFNRGIRERNRYKIITFMKSQFELESVMPSDLEGLPLANNQNSWFFPYYKNRQSTDIQNLWVMAKLAVQSGRLDKTTFDQCLRIKQIALPKLTQGLFWVRPDVFLPFDTNTRAYLEENDIRLRSNDYDGYNSLLDIVKSRLGNDVAKISRDAYLRTRNPVRDPELSPDDHVAAGGIYYAPIEEDVIMAYRAVANQGEEISVDLLLKQIENDIKNKGYTLRSDWRNIVEEHLKKRSRNWR